MSSNFKSFMEDVEKQIKQEERNIINETNKIIIFANKTLIRNSPVDKGQFIANHLITQDQPTDKVLILPNIATIGKQEALSKMNSEANKLKFSKDTTSIYIQNNLPYAPAIEAGHSKQSLSGVYGITEEQTRQFINRLKI